MIRRAIGAEHERTALEYLQARGLKLVTKNFNCRMGEIDLIMRDQNTLVFVEVRFRNSRSHGGAVASINYKKQQKLWRTAQYYLVSIKKYDKIACRFDIIAIEMQGQQTHIQWLQNALENIR